jgi:hypothetical protein
MSKLTLQELNGLSPRARKAHEDSNVISKETKKGKKNEKL